MADGQENDDRSEEATPERREDFRERGQVAISREISSVLVLVGCVVFLSFLLPQITDNFKALMTSHLQRAGTMDINVNNVLEFGFKSWVEVLYATIPIFIVVLVI